MGQPVEQRRGQLGIAEHVGPFREAQVGGDDQAGLLVELAEQVEQQRTAGLAERQIAEFIEDDEIGVGQAVGELALLAGESFPAPAR